jgi:hypothetical protein
VLASGTTARLSHLPLGFVHGIFRGSPPPPEVTIGIDHGRTRPGIRIHRSTLHRLDVEIYAGIPATTRSRMLLDLAPRLAPEQLGRACHEAWVLRRATPQSIEACIARNPRKPGTAKLRAALGSDVTLSKLESGVFRLLRRHDLPLPRTNIDVQGDKVDCHWPQLGLTIELLSFRFHATRHAFKTDVARRRRLNHVAYTWGDVFERAHGTARDVARRLNAAYGSTSLPPA